MSRSSIPSSMFGLILVLLVISCSTDYFLFSFGFTVVTTTNTPSTSSLNAGPQWFFPPAAGDQPVEDVVDVRIERPTSNSRRIIGDISIPGVAVNDVWSILTDYDRLALHVPNLKESRVVQEDKNNSPGDGAYQCQLYQVGAQKIIGFDFSASVTMEMTEQILLNQNHMIYFKCVDSMFFNAFDGSWTVRQQRDGVVCSYDVLVKPKGPVPVTALEWQIKAEVPNNLRAVKKAALVVAQANTKGKEVVGTSPSLEPTPSIPTRNVVVTAARMAMGTKRVRQQISAAMEDWETQSETMGKYL
mmetsp:Transcript_35500/g.40528  ORF Transcript_35500/g.40528 Transcript_35500/m.40528 type:complete len:301 (+) Transcript_35500:290-1192(+)